MAHVRLAPDLVGLLRPDQLERDGAHRRHRCELDEPFGLGVTELAGDARDCVKPGDEQTGGAVCADVLGHTWIFATASDGPAQGVASRDQTFASRRSTAGSLREAPKLITPAANTFAPAGVS